MMVVESDNMEPEIRKKTCAFNRRTHPLRRRDYVIGVGNEVGIYTTHDLGTSILLLSLNPSHGPKSLDRDDAGISWYILGRVVWWCRESINLPVR